MAEASVAARVAAQMRSIPSLSAMVRHEDLEPAMGDSDYMRDLVRYQRLEHHLRHSQTLFEALYMPYLSMRHCLELPTFRVENQPAPHFVRGLGWGDIRRIVFCQNVANAAIAAVREQQNEHCTELGQMSPEDVTIFCQVAAKQAYRPAPEEDATAETLPPPDVDLEGARRFKLKKWLLQRDEHDGALDAAAARKVRGDHKKNITRIMLAVFENYTNTEAVRAFFAALKAAGVNQHDIFDAFALAMQAALDEYAALASKILPRRKPHEVRSDTPPLFDQAITRHGTIRVAALDPGINNIGFCVVELAGMVMPPPGRVPVLGGEPHEPEPVFRILCMELIDLDSEWSPTMGHAKRTLRCSDNNVQWMEPRYDAYPSSDLRSIFSPVKMAALPAPPAGSKKRKQPEPKTSKTSKVKIKIEGEATKKKPRKPPHKKAKTDTTEPEFPPL